MEKYLKAELIKHKAIDNSINMNLKLCLKYIKENVLI
ncbi:hypothetical protein SAMN04488528_1001226 [Clostridium frigidicarnis]|uniref:Uncharacterized protein n=1 Tax=Clostridium frigidicarnis TaxID=84698 RepID=A0A1I0V838_9CLOT|nr:hypothetical protein SAMN04488528_1001226 [Clostridium frigidicarnis]